MNNTRFSFFATARGWVGIRTQAHSPHKHTAVQQYSANHPFIVFKRTFDIQFLCAPRAWLCHPLHSDTDRVGRSVIREGLSKQYHLPAPIRLSSLQLLVQQVSPVPLPIFHRPIQAGCASASDRTSCPSGLQTDPEHHR